MDLFRSFFERQPELLPASQSSSASEAVSPPSAKPAPSTSYDRTTELTFREGKPQTQNDNSDEANDGSHDQTKQQQAIQPPEQHLDQLVDICDKPTDSRHIVQEPFSLGKLQADYPVVTPAKRGPSQSASPVPLGGAVRSPTLQLDGEPVPLGHPSSPENVSLMHQLFINRCVRPEFYYSQVTDQFTWACKLTFDLPLSIAEAASIPSYKVNDSAGSLREIWESHDANNRTWTVTVQDRHPYPTKKVAKEHVAVMAIPILQILPQPSKRSPKVSSEVEENWVGRLLEYCNATGVPQALYQEFKTGQGFACELSMQARQDFVFGGRDKTFPNKKSAKAAAAREAMLWLRETGRTAEVDARRSRRSLKKEAETHDSKRQKTTTSSPSQIEEIGAVSPAVLSPVSPSAPLESQSRPAEDMATDQDRGSYTKKVTALCATLNMKVPIYHTRPHPSAPSLFSVSATFAYARDLASLHLFQILPRDQTGVSVSNVKVRSAALDQCAQRVYEVLLDLQHSLDAARLAGLSITVPAIEPQTTAPAITDSNEGTTTEQQQTLAVSTVA